MEDAGGFEHKGALLTTRPRTRRRPETLITGRIPSAGKAIKEVMPHDEFVILITFMYNRHMDPYESPCCHSVSI